MTDTPAGAVGGRAIRDEEKTERIYELLAEFKVNDTDTLKHTLEDHDRWRHDVVELSIDNEALRKKLASLTAVPPAQSEPLCICGSRREEHGADGIWHEYTPAPKTAVPPARPEDFGPDPNCQRCKGTGEEPNAQFRCACRWKPRALSSTASQQRMPPCSACGHSWAVHVIPGGVDNIDVYPYERWCDEHGCRCRNYTPAPQPETAALVERTKWAIGLLDGSGGDYALIQNVLRDLLRTVEAIQHQVGNS